MAGLRIRTLAQEMEAPEHLPCLPYRWGLEPRVDLYRTLAPVPKARASPIPPAGTCDWGRRCLVGDTQQETLAAPLNKLPDCHLSMTPLVGIMTPGSNQAQPEKEIMATRGPRILGEKRSEGIVVMFPSSRSGENSDPARKDTRKSFERRGGLSGYTELQPPSCTECPARAGMPVGRGPLGHPRRFHHLVVSLSVSTLEVRMAGWKGLSAPGPHSEP